MAQELDASISFKLKVTVYTNELKDCSPDVFWKLPGIHKRIIQQTNMRWNLIRYFQLPLAWYKELVCYQAGLFLPQPLTDILGQQTELVLLTRFESRNTTITVMSSWKWRGTPRSIFFKCEYLISPFFAATFKAAFTSLLALPCKN